VAEKLKIWRYWPLTVGKKGKSITTRTPYTITPSEYDQYCRDVAVEARRIGVSPPELEQMIFEAP
jgi:hypothetical protein